MQDNDIMGPYYKSFSPCFTLLISIDSDSDSSSSEEENLYYSTYDNKIKKSYAAKPLPEKKDEHNFCLTLKVRKGLLTIYAPVRVSFI